MGHRIWCSTRPLSTDVMALGFTCRVFGLCLSRCGSFDIGDIKSCLPSYLPSLSPACWFGCFHASLMDLLALSCCLLLAFWCGAFFSLVWVFLLCFPLHQLLLVLVSHCFILNIIIISTITCGMVSYYLLLHRTVGYLEKVIPADKGGNSKCLHS